MYKLCFVLNTFSLISFSFCAGYLTDNEALPSWIKDNPGFQDPTEVDSIKTGNGSLSTNKKGNSGWKIFLNEKTGHGIELEIEKLNLNPNSNEFLLVSSWPINLDFQQIQLFTGIHPKPLRKLRIPNAKAFYILFSASENSETPEMALTYRRYGISLEIGPPPTDIPFKKETVYEIQLKGKSLDEFSAAEFLSKVKEGLKESARRFCTFHKIPFNESIPKEEMVLFHRISFCPFEWPERSICTSVEHSIFVSGVSRPGEESILDYELTADHLKNMWSEDNFQELNDLGIKVYQLPAASNTVLYWSLIIGLVIVSSLIGTFIFWKANHLVQNNSRKNSTTSYIDVKKTKKPKLRLAKHQQVPSFMYKSPKDNQMDSALRAASEKIRLQQKTDIGMKSEDSSELPIKNYFGGILFGINRAFEDEDDSQVEFRSKPHAK